MRFMMIVKANKESEAGALPSEKLLTAMNKYNQELAKAGALLDLNGLQPSSKGSRVTFSHGRTSVVDGPFSETKELIGGYWVIQAASKEEAIEWAKRVPFTGPENDGAVIEIRQVHELEDFGPSAAVGQARELTKQVAKSK